MEENKHQDDKPVYMISVAAELAGMHPQTLRIYERKELLTPERTPKSTRLYSRSDIERLKFIQRLTHEEGVNLAGVKMIMDLQSRIEVLEGALNEIRKQLSEKENRLVETETAVSVQTRRELVLIPKGALVMVEKTKKRRR